MHKMMIFILLALLSPSCMKDSDSGDAQKAINLQASTGCRGESEKKNEDIVSHEKSSSPVEKGEDFSFDNKAKEDSGCTL